MTAHSSGSVRILNLQVARVDMAAAVRRVEEFIRAFRAARAAGGELPPLAHVVTANSEIAMLAWDNPAVADIVKQAALVVADGIGLVWAARLLGQPLPERIAGIDLMENVLAQCAGEGWRPYLLGAAPGVAEEARAALERRHRGLQVAGTHHGYLEGIDTAALVEAINAAQPDLLLVAMGAPRQERWIAAHRHELKVPVAVGVGGSLDVWAGRAVRAPRWMGEMGLEWAYRLMRQPTRIVRMMALPRFAFTVLWHKWRGRTQVCDHPRHRV